MAEDRTVRCKVVGPAEVLGVAAPGVVELDPDVYNIHALVYAGHVQVLAESAPDTDTATKSRRGSAAAES